MPKPTSAELQRRFAVEADADAEAKAWAKDKEEEEEEEDDMKLSTKKQTQACDLVDTGHVHASVGSHGLPSESHEQPGEHKGGVARFLKSGSPAPASSSAPSSDVDAGAISSSTSPRRPSSTLASSFLPSLSVSADPNKSSGEDYISEGSFDSDLSGDELQRRVATPKVAKELSQQLGGFVAVTTLDPMKPDEDENATEGLALQGYSRGIPIYYATAGVHSQLAGILTKTAIGFHYVKQPVETCFGGASSVDGLPPSRTFENQWIRVAESSLQGYGVFAADDIAQYTEILLERPFMRLARLHDLDRAYMKLTAEERAVFDGLWGWHPKSHDPVFRRWSANHFELSQLSDVGVFAIASNFNHACYSKRNVQYRWDDRRRVMTFTAMREVKKGEELLISYGRYRVHLRANYGFDCGCGGCE